MSKHTLAEQLQLYQVLAARAPTAAVLNELPEMVRSRVHQANHDRTGYVELRTRIETAQIELMVVPIDGSEPLWLARTSKEP